MEKKRTITLPSLAAALLLIALLVQCPAAQAGTYNPTTVYKGPYAPVLLYYKAPDSGTWKRGNFEVTYARAVTCPQALQSFKESGYWKGRLQKDGSCSNNAQLLEWAVGNRLNYDKGMF